MAIEVGKKAPAFTLPDDSGKTVSLKDFAGKRVVLYFYPRDQTPGCTTEACEFRDQAALFKRKGAVVLGVSKDTVASHAKFKEKQRLNFPLLADVDSQVMQAYGAWGEKVLYGKKSVGCIRSTVLIGADGKIEKIWPKVKVAGHVDEVLAAIDAAG